MRHQLNRAAILTAALALALVALPRATDAAPMETIELDNFREGIGKVAKRIIDIVEGEGQHAVKFFGFLGPRRSNSGPGIEQSLILALNQLEPGFVQENAALTVQGVYKLLDDKGEKKRGFLNLSIDIRDQDEKPVKQFNVELRSPPDIARLLQVTGSLSEKGDRKERNIELKRQAEKPSVFISGAEVRANAESMFSVVLAVKPHDSDQPAQPREAKQVNGQAFVEIEPGEVYEILIRNDSNEEVAAEITIDGLSVFAFSEKRDSVSGQPTYTHYLVDRHETATIVGWHLRDKPPDNYASFLVSEYGKGNLGQVARPAQGNTGVVFVAFARSFPRGKGRGRGANETGLGPPRSVNVEPAERDLMPPHEFVAIRYSR